MVMFQLFIPGPRMSPYVGAAVPNQYTSFTTDPLGVVTTWPWKRSGLYFRKQNAQGVYCRPSGNATVAFPSYQCCSALGTSTGCPATTLGRAAAVPPAVENEPSVAPLI